MLNNLKQKAAKVSGMPKDILLNLPLITIIGNAEATIENFKGIIEYTDTVIRVNTAKGIVRITGKNLLLKQVTVEIISVTGLISGIEFF